MAGWDFDAGRTGRRPRGAGPRIRKLEDRLLLSATPEATVEDLPAVSLINEGFGFTVEFENTADPNQPDPQGYAPFFDLTVEPGAQLTGADYEGSALTLDEVATWDGVQWIDAQGDPVAEHPLDEVGGLLALPTGTVEGQIWYLLELPFGSYGPDQPTLPINFSGTLNESADPAMPQDGAEPGVPVQITSRGGFRFGLDSLDNPSTDPPIQQSTTSTDTITPVILTISKDVALPEGETAQGPNFEFDYVISIDVANGATVENVVLTDLLPDNLFFLDAVSSDPSAVIDAPGAGQPQGIPGLDTAATATFEFARIDGVQGVDATITLTAYAPESDASGVDLIDTAAPTSTTALNEVSATADFEGAPIDPGLAPTLTDDATAIIRPYTVQKSVEVVGGGDAVPGALLRFTVEIDVSDYQSFQDFDLTDVLSDGLTLDTSSGRDPEATVRQDGVQTVLTLDQTTGPNAELETRFLPGTDPNDPFGQELIFRLSQAELNDGGDGTFSGDLWQGDPLDNDPTTISLVYFARIEESFREPGRGAVVVNDRFSNSVSGGANSSDGGGPAEDDGSGAGIGVPAPDVRKEVYAVNGVIG
ncbi:MAG: hypothetical protein AAGI51_07780, partial [Pseudomonadota bacterium]